jgi:hypothetical protein
MIFLIAAAMTLSSTSVEINEPLTVTLTLAEGEKADPGLLRGNLLQQGKFLLLDEKQSGLVREYVLEPLEAGIFPISFYKIGKGFGAVQFVEVKPFSAPSKPPLSATFLPLAPDIPLSLSSENLSALEKINDAQPERNLRLYNAKLFPWRFLLAVLALAALLPYLLYRAMEYLKRPPPTPEEKAEKRLTDLKEKQLSPEAFYIETANTLRDYIQDRYGVKAPYLTTEEFLVQAAGNPSIDLPDLSKFLEEADLVKFAKKAPADQEKYIEFVLQYIKN